VMFHLLSFILIVLVKSSAVAFLLHTTRKVEILESCSARDKIGRRAMGSIIS
jgi:hypothetical protein